MRLLTRCLGCFPRAIATYTIPSACFYAQTLNINVGARSQMDGRYSQFVQLSSMGGPILQETVRLRMRRTIPCSSNSREGAPLYPLGLVGA